MVFSFHFEAPRQGGAGVAPVQEGWCVAPSGEKTRFRVHDEQGASSDGLRVYAGLRAEPFFIDVPALIETQKTGRLAFKEVGTNTAIGFNVLSIVVEADCQPWLRSGCGPLLAVVGETVVAGKLPVRIERIGRPEIKNVILQLKQFDQVNRDLEVRDLYNLEDAFHISKDYGGVYRARMHANLAMNDRLDGKIDWPLGPDGVHPLTELLLADYLVVDITKPYAADSFFEIEQATLDGRAHQTCGGRSLNDDVIDKELTLLVNGGKGPRVSDGVDRPQTPVSDAFPYQAPPTSSATGQARARPCNWPTKLARTATMTSKSTVVLELDDIQAGALEPRPVPYAGLYQILRLDDRHGGRELPAAANPVSQLSCLLRSQDAGVARRGTQLPGTQSPRGAGGVTRYLSPRVSAGNGRTAAELGDVGENSPEHWEKPLGSQDVHLVVAGLAPDSARLEAAVRYARDALRDLPGVVSIWQQHVYSGLTCATCSVSQMASAIRPSRVPAFPAPIRTKCRSRPASSSWGTRTRPTASPQYHSPKCWGSTAPTQSSASCTRG